MFRTILFSMGIFFSGSIFSMQDNVKKRLYISYVETKNNGDISFEISHKNILGSDRIQDKIADRLVRKFSVNVDWNLRNEYGKCLILTIAKEQRQIQSILEEINAELNRPQNNFTNKPKTP